MIRQIITDIESIRSRLAMLVTELKATTDSKEKDELRQSFRELLIVLESKLDKLDGIPYSKKTPVCETGIL